MKTVILAEKPSQAKAYAAALKTSQRNDGYFKVSDPMFNGDTFITYGFGHLVNLAEPGSYSSKWDKWDLETLPIFPETYQFTVPEDKKKQFKVVEKLLNSADRIIIATDSDREGSNIAWSIMKESKINFKTTCIERLWINSLETDVIREGFQNLRNAIEEDYPLYIEAQTRQIADWLIGMNASPLYSLNLQKKGIQGSFSLGRVQTPTLYMIYKRELDISNFKSESFNELEGIASCNAGKFVTRLNPYKRFEDKSECIRFLENHKASFGTQKTLIDAIETKSKKEYSPFLHSLSSLQTKVNSLYKASPKQTLDAAQALYDAKFLSYPRSDAHFITENEFAYLAENVDRYRDFLQVKLSPSQKKPRKRFVDGQKVQEHHAIIPTRKLPSNEEFEKLTDIQKKVYLLVLKTTFAMFLPDYEYDETVIDIKVGSLFFTAKGKQPKREGWKVLFPDKEKENKDTLPSQLNEGQEIVLDIKNIEKKTTPPSSYTEGTLITAMKTAGKTLEDEESQLLLKQIEGIGTEATRANIIESLKQKEYIVIKNNKVVITEKGIILCEAVTNRKLLTSAEMTSEWETYLRKIGSKSGGKQQIFLNNVKKFIIHLIENVPEDIKTLDTNAYEEKIKEKELANTFGTCPECGGLIKHKKTFYGCSNYPKCRFSLPDSFRKKNLTKTNVAALLNNESTTVKGIKNKEKKVYAAVIKLKKNNETGSCSLEFVSFATTAKKKTGKGKR